MLKAIWNWMKERAFSLWEKIRAEPLLVFSYVGDSPSDRTSRIRHVLRDL